MKIFKKMLEYFLLLIGLVAAAAIIMFFCMYFFNTTFFNYGWKKAPAESETYLIYTEKNVQNIEINTNAVKVEIMSAAENKVVYTDKFSGIVKGTKLDDGSIEISRSYANVLEENNRTIINVVEPNNGWFSIHESCLQVYISEDTLNKGAIPNIVINTEKSNVFVNLGTFRCNVEFNGKGKAALTADSFISKLTGNFGIGKVVSNVNVGNVNITTQSGTIQVGGDVIGDKVGAETIRADVSVYANNANLKFNDIFGTLTYLGKNSDAASGGKIQVNNIGDGLTIESRTFDANIASLKGGCNVLATSNGNLTIDKFDDLSTATKNISTAKGNVKINHLNVNNIAIETTNGAVTLVATSNENYTNNNTIDVSTTNGSINIVACETNNNVIYKFNGSITAHTEKGEIIVKDIYCKVNLVSSDNGKVVGYFRNIITCSSLETNKGDCISNIYPDNPALLNVIANNKTINLPNTTSFYDGTKLTPIYNATEGDIKNNPVLTLISKNGKLEVKQFI